MTSLAAALRDERHRRGRAGADRRPRAAARAPSRAAGWRVFVTPRRPAIGGSTPTGMDFDAYWAARPGAAAQHRQAARPRRPGSRSRSTTGSTHAPGPITKRSTGRAGSPRKAPSRSCARWPSRRARPARCGSASRARTAGRSRSQLWLVENGEATIHKLAYAEDAKAMSPGTMLGMAMFRRALDEDRVRGDRLRHRRRRLQEGLDGRAARRSGGSTPTIPRTLRGLLGAARARASALVRRAAEPLGPRPAAAETGEDMATAPDDAHEVENTLRAVLADVLGLDPRAGRRRSTRRRPCSAPCPNSIRWRWRAC